MAIRVTSKVPGALEGLNIKWDRTIVFLLGCAALLLALVTGILAPLTAAVTWPWPVFLLLLGAGSIAALRYLAVQDRHERSGAAAGDGALDAAAEPAESGETASVFDNEEHVEQESLRREQQELADLDLPEDYVFLDDLMFAEDSEDAEYQVPRGAQAPAELPEHFSAEELESTREPVAVARDVPTHEELVAAARKVAVKSAQASGTTWEPVPVPKPTYARTAVAHREQPQALVVPKVPAPARDQSLKDAAKAPEPQTAKAAGIDLDDVLNRRRA